jgi:HEAT repeat protein
MFSMFILRKLRSADSIVRRVALEQVKSLDDGKVLDEVVRMLVKDENVVVRNEAEKAILRTKPAAAPDRLKVLLTSPKARTRYSAARTLHGIGWVPSTCRERAELAVGEGKFELAAKEGAVALDPLAMEARTGANHETPACSAMAAIGQAAVPRLLAIFQGSSRGADIARGVAKRGNRASEIFFVEGLKSRGTHLETLCNVLAETPMPRITVAVIRVLQDPTNSTSVRRAAARALARSGDDNAVAALVSTFKNDSQADPALRSEIASLLERRKAGIASS